MEYKDFFICEIRAETEIATGRPSRTVPMDLDTPALILDRPVLRAPAATFILMRKHANPSKWRNRPGPVKVPGIIARVVTDMRCGNGVSLAPI